MFVAASFAQDGATSIRAPPITAKGLDVGATTAATSSPAPAPRTAAAAPAAAPRHARDAFIVPAYVRAIRPPGRAGNPRRQLQEGSQPEDSRTTSLQDASCLAGGVVTLPWSRTERSATAAICPRSGEMVVSVGLDALP